MPEIPNDLLNRAIMTLARRSEKAAPAELVQTFVDVGPLFTLLSIPDNQVIYGRRGTGKTHALLYLSEIRRRAKDIPIYVDLSRLGSTGGIYTDSGLPLVERATRLLVDTLAAIHESLYEQFVNAADTYDLSTTGPLLDQLANAITSVRVVGTVEQENTQQSTASSSQKHDTSLTADSAAGIKAHLGETRLNKNEAEVGTKTTVTGVAQHTVNFGTVRGVLEQMTKAVKPGRILVLLDEWSSVPLELQPYLADLIRRSMFPIREVTVKIAAIEYRSVFKVGGDKGSYLGIELGADASTDINLDDFMVFDNDAARAREFYRSMITKHIAAADLIKQSPFAASLPDDLFTAAFTQITAFDELVKAAEGVPRDAIHIASLAAQYAGKSKIAVPNVRQAAHSWYQTGKATAVSSRATTLKLLHWIIDKVIGDRKARAFLLQNDSNDPLIEELFDARVLHIVKRNISTHDQPGLRYHVYKLDYGCYVDLMATAKAPKGLLPVDPEFDPSGFVDIPSDDYRAIRRAILDLSEFRKTNNIAV